MKRKKPPTLRSEIASLRRAMLRIIKATYELQKQVQSLRLDITHIPGSKQWPDAPFDSRAIRDYWDAHRKAYAKELTMGLTNGTARMHREP